MQRADEYKDNRAIVGKRYQPITVLTLRAKRDDSCQRHKRHCTADAQYYRGH